ncbi:MAG TPA: DnaJ domain-containing protein [Clostridia bacterium]|nr:DnaJ domain-containing protein [Clostridia bacterium]
MYIDADRIREIKRKLRELKKLEVRIRFGGSSHAANLKDATLERPVGIPLIWDEFFHLEERPKHGKPDDRREKPLRTKPVCTGAADVKARYTLADVAAMSHEEYRNVIDEFFFNVYYKYYTENGITGTQLYDPELLSRMGLPADAGAEDIKRRFRELAKKYHPDVGGNEAEFIELMENYRKLTE